MKKILATLLAVVGVTAGTANDRHEASMNFDLDRVGPFLDRLNNTLSLDLDVEELVAFTAGVPVEDEKAIELSVPHAGESVYLEYRVFMDDVSAPDLYFFSSSASLVKAIQEQMGLYAEELGI